MITYFAAMLATVVRPKFLGLSSERAKKKIYLKRAFGTYSNPEISCLIVPIHDNISQLKASPIAY